MILGKYIHRESPIHATSVGVKFVVLLAMSTMLFFSKNLIFTFSLSIIAFAFVFLTKLPMKTFIAHIKPTGYIMAMLFVYHCFYTNITLAAIIVFKLEVLFILGVVFSLSSKTSAIMDAITSLLRPIQRLGVNTDNVAISIYLTQNFMAILIKEYHTLKSAQVARGIKTSFLRLIVPFFIRAFTMSHYVVEAIISKNVGD